MNVPEYHLKHVLLSWSGLNPDEYDGDTELANMWNGTTKNDYEPVGIKKLLTLLRQDNIFKNCPARRSLQIQDLAANGTITTVLKLYVQLQNCGKTATFRPTGPSTLV